uniref:Putative ovule protein n=1 Tax=Solanum chacoense TaxID=4108 RepID=A0A0V0H434_SOLCH
MYSEVDPVPLQIDSSSHEESLTASATVWVQSNMVKLSQHFGVDLKGCKKEAYTLLMKLDQRREKDKRLGGERDGHKYKQYGCERGQKLIFRHEFQG